MNDQREHPSSGFGGVFPQNWGRFPSIRVLTRICVYLRVFELYSTKYAYQGRISLYYGVLWAYFTAELQRGRIRRVFVVYQCVFACIQRTLCNTRSIRVGYTSDTVFSTQSNVGPGLVNVSWVEYG